MAATLERLVYESIATGSTESLLNLATILAESQANNARHGLTGALAAHAGRYVQVIEGTPSALDALLRRLVDDPRHRAIVIIERKPIAERMFDGWNMAAPILDAALTPALDALMAEPAPSGGRITRLLKDALSSSEPQPA